MAANMDIADKSASPILDQTLAGIVRRLIDAYRPERIYLFGSRARSDFGTDSDYDLLVVVPNAVVSPMKCFAVRAWPQIF